jgi:predicted 2-oxoglutarate/Fe(II)-dependent dioxygenase YbiX
MDGAPGDDPQPPHGLSAGGAAAAAGAGKVAKRAARTYGEEEEEEQAPWTEQLTHALALVRPSGAFACDGSMQNVPAYAPAVTVEGVGRLALPLCADQATALRAVAEPAPFGRGTETVVDEEVRRALQVPAARVTVGPAGWAAALAHTVARAVAALGVGNAAAQGITAQLDKLILYESGGHFQPHKDTEKAAGLFATLVVQLPVEGGHEGGNLVIRHCGRRVRVNFAASSKHTALHFAAFYADCTHELTPVTSGTRLALLYKLVRTGPSREPLPAPADTSGVDAALCAAARAWAAAGPGSRPRVALRLEHEYTESSISFASLKGRDAAKMRALLGCPLLDVRLALVDKVVTGTADDPGFGYDDDFGGDADAEGVEMQEVDSTELATVKWIAPKGRPKVALDDFSDEDLLDDSETLLDIDDGDPDEREYEGYQGNYAGTLTFTYHTTLAVAVVWPVFL